MADLFKEDNPGMTRRGFLAGSASAGVAAWCALGAPSASASSVEAPAPAPPPPTTDRAHRTLLGVL